MGYRKDYHIEWDEYAEYLLQNTELTKNQSYAVAGKCYGIKDEKIAESINTTKSAISTQRNRIDYESLSEKTQKLFVKPHVPATKSRLIGEIEYVNADVWQENGQKGYVNIFATVGSRSGNNYVIVEENYTEEYDDKSDELFVRHKDVQEVIIYKCVDDFIDMSTHSPKNIPDVKDESIRKKGILFNN